MLARVHHGSGIHAVDCNLAVVAASNFCPTRIIHNTGLALHRVGAHEALDGTAAANVSNDNEHQHDDCQLAVRHDEICFNCSCVM